MKFLNWDQNFRKYNCSNCNSFNIFLDESGDNLEYSDDRKSKFYFIAGIIICDCSLENLKKELFNIESTIINTDNKFKLIGRNLKYNKNENNYYDEIDNKIYKKKKKKKDKYYCDKGIEYFAEIKAAFLSGTQIASFLKLNIQTHNFIYTGIVFDREYEHFALLDAKKNNIDPYDILINQLICFLNEFYINNSCKLKLNLDKKPKNKKYKNVLQKHFSAKDISIDYHDSKDNSLIRLADIYCHGLFRFFNYEIKNEKKERNKTKEILNNLNDKEIYFLLQQSQSPKSLYPYRKFLEPEHPFNIIKNKLLTEDILK